MHEFLTYIKGVSSNQKVQESCNDTLLRKKSKSSVIENHFSTQNESALQYGNNKMESFVFLWSRYWYAFNTPFLSLKETHYYKQKI